MIEVTITVKVDNFTVHFEEVRPGNMGTGSRALAIEKAQGILLEGYQKLLKSLESQ